MLTLTLTLTRTLTPQGLTLHPSVLMQSQASADTLDPRIHVQVVAANGGNWTIETPALNGSSKTHHSIGTEGPFIPTDWGRQGAPDVADLREQVRVLQAACTVACVARPPCRSAAGMHRWAASPKYACQAPNHQEQSLRLV